MVGDIGVDRPGRTTRFDHNFTANDIQVRYHVFQISEAGDPSICEVYFTFSNRKVFAT